jgi:hypothetical protein
MNGNTFKKITQTIEQKGEISPFLFLHANLEILHGDIDVFIRQLFIENTIDAQSLFHLQDA